MVKVIGVRFQNAGKLYFFDPGSYCPLLGILSLRKPPAVWSLAKWLRAAEIADDQRDCAA